MLCWGGITLASMVNRHRHTFFSSLTLIQAAHNFSEMAALRFLLGVFEPAIVPGLILTTARFYKPREVPIRIAFWTLANTLMPIPFSVIYYGLGNLPNHPLQQWR
jgi:ACS family allantoate permease-like MFS transporter